MSKKFVTVKVPLVELSSDSDSVHAQTSTDTPQPTGSATARSNARREAARPTVSDDEVSTRHVLMRTPTPSPRESPTSVLPQARRPAIISGPPAPAPPHMAAPPAPRSAARPPMYQARMSVGGWRPTHQLAFRDMGAPHYPSIHERGESSRQPSQWRELGALTAELRDMRQTFQRMQGDHGRVLDRLGAMEPAAVHIVPEGHREQGATLRRMVIGAVVAAVVAVVVSALPYFFPHR